MSKLYIINLIKINLSKTLEYFIVRTFSNKNYSNKSNISIVFIQKNRVKKLKMILSRHDRIIIERDFKLD